VLAAVIAFVIAFVLAAVLAVATVVAFVVLLPGGNHSIIKCNKTTKSSGFHCLSLQPY